MSLYLESRIPTTIALSLFLALSFGCDTEKAPEAPSTSSSAQRVDQSKGDQPIDEEDLDDSDATAASKINFGGAKVGDPDTRDEVTECLDDGKFFDRFKGDMGSCTKLDLAKVDCSKSGLQKIMSAKQRAQFKDSLAGTYKGWLVDQCVDCGPKSDSPTCENKDGEKQVGTKVFFVIEEDTEIRGKSMLIPVRPKQAADDEDKE